MITIPKINSFDRVRINSFKGVDLLELLQNPLFDRI